MAVSHMLWVVGMDPHPLWEYQALLMVEPTGSQSPQDGSFDAYLVCTVTESGTSECAITKQEASLWAIERSCSLWQFERKYPLKKASVLDVEFLWRRYGLAGRGESLWSWALRSHICSSHAQWDSLLLVPCLSTCSSYLSSTVSTCKLPYSIVMIMGWTSILKASPHNQMFSCHDVSTPMGTLIKTLICHL